VSASPTPEVPDTTALAAFCDEVAGDHLPIEVARMRGGGSCEVFSVDRGDARWVLRRAPRRANTSRAHDVLREFRILDAIKDEPVRIARPVAACDDPDVFGSAFYLMDRIDGVPVRTSVPPAWAAAPETHGQATVDLCDALVEIGAVDWQACGLGDMGHEPGYLSRQIDRWLSQLASYDGRDLPAAAEVGEWLRARLPAEQPQALCHGDYKLDNALFALDLPPRVLAVVDWEMASIGDPLVDLCWMLVFHPGEGGLTPLGTGADPKLEISSVPSLDEIVARYGERSGRDLSAIDWYHVFARWKLGIVLEGSFAKWQKGLSDNPMHEYFGPQTDKALASALDIVRGPAQRRQ
jgi:aminoglycoside phosphotransferase (APT) family kinase protein